MNTTPAEAALQAHLLSIGGTAVHLELSMIPAADPENLESGAPVPFLDDAEILLRRGTLHTGPVTLRAGYPALCHHNAATLFVHHCDDDRARLDLMTGYALHGGSWHRHSWLTEQQSGTLVETTYLFGAYYGVRLSSAEDHDDPDGSAWHFWTLHGLHDSEAAAIARTVTGGTFTGR
ncbi:hypothetical protein [Deinococcus soli (ex Cha et al. 2016)]|uniref:Uncharacterized protein n=2 Tax=Deinococcus soli (ex Cha et al. 2016) TaxID=1309411 RepID=A0AAE3XCV2_9DEIO|nr:hypothetical protein [Deinococcus soli (ex Cha et al. 2016)]MDR6218319.1 hypothetical protein [Deinococcus soli (ex Cha et al. 2016)]MDR6329059.1 hypothetical protein [Deinococcus soli (ex Cha et al. 2016)]MDR6751332.1 hypothetical protein [Deinococcus soli (ex Cha et al. 2016)]